MQSLDQVIYQRQLNESSLTLLSQQREDKKILLNSMEKERKIRIQIEGQLTSRMEEDEQHRIDAVQAKAEANKVLPIIYIY